jgi:transposase
MYKQFIGINISKDSFDITLLESNAEIKLQDKLTMDKDGFNKLLNYLASYSKDNLLIAMEATGIYHLPLLSGALQTLCKIRNRK